MSQSRGGVAPHDEYESLVARARAGDVAAARAAVARLDARAPWRAAPLDVLTLAAEAGDVIAQRRLGIRYCREDSDLDASPEEAVRWLRPAADAGDPEAQVWYGRFFVHGVPVVDGPPERGADLYEAAHRQGHAAGTHELALCFYRGRGRAGDPTRGLSLMREAADAGHAPAEYFMAATYRAGRQVERDPGQVLAWLARAAEHGHWQAQWDLGRHHRDGRLVTADAAAAMQWLELAAAQGRPEPATDLARMRIARGELAVAKVWLRRAAGRGHSPAQGLLDAVDAVIAERDDARAIAELSRTDPEVWGAGFDGTEAPRGRAAARRRIAAIGADAASVEEIAGRLADLGPNAMGELLVATEGAEGEPAFPALVRALADASFPPALGRMVEWLGHPSVAVRRDAARALAPTARRTLSLRVDDEGRVRPDLEEVRAWWAGEGHARVPALDAWWAEVRERTRRRAAAAAARVRKARESVPPARRSNPPGSIRDELAREVERSLARLGPDLSAELRLGHLSNATDDARALLARRGRAPRPADDEVLVEAVVALADALRDDRIVDLGGGEDGGMWVSAYGTTVGAEVEGELGRLAEAGLPPALTVRALAALLPDRTPEARRAAACLLTSAEARRAARDVAVAVGHEAVIELLS